MKPPQTNNLEHSMSVSLIQKMAPFYMETPYIEAAELPKTLILRGLFSTSLTDREREFAEPTSFNLDDLISINFSD